MVRHILFWRFSDAVTSRNRAEVFDLLHRSVKTLEAIDGVVRCEIGEALPISDCDFVFYSEFTSEEALRAFQNHPLHIAHKQRMAPYVQNRLCADYLF